MEKVVELMQSYRDRAYDEIKAAKLLYESHLFAAAISRAYYASFYAINYIFLQDNIDVKTHKQLAIEFRKLYIKTGKFDKKISKILTQLFNCRMLCDYEASIDLEQEHVRHLIDLAEEFVSGITN